MPQPDVAHFTTVDHTSDPGFFLRFLDEANKIQGVAEWKLAIVDALHLKAGLKVLDPGCGAGTDVFDLAGRVGPTGHVTGVDFSECLIAEAVRRAARRNLSVTFETGDAQSLRFSDESFDAVRTERMLMHVPDPGKAMSEMAAPARWQNGGPRLRVGESVVRLALKETTRKIALSFYDSMRNGWIGRRLPRIFREAGMTDVAVSFLTILLSYDFPQLLLGGHIAGAVSAGTLSENEADLWWTHLARANNEGTFHYGFTAAIVSGVKVAVTSGGSDEPVGLSCAFSALAY